MSRRESKSYFGLNTWKTIGLSILLFILFFLNLFSGSIHIPFREVIDILFYSGSENEVWSNIIFKSRLPQTLTALLAGAALSVSGLQMQTLFRNALAGPSVLGISSGASLGVAIIILFMEGALGISLHQMGMLGNIGVSLAAFLGSMSVLVIIMLAAKRVNSNTVLLIIGVMLGYAGASIVGVLKFYANQADLKTYVIWGLGSFANISVAQLPFFLISIVVLLLASLLLIKPMNLYLLGEKYAQNLGVNIKQTRFLLITLSGLLVSITTAFTGPIAFLGLAIPHVTRNFYCTSDHKKLLPLTILIGAIVALLCNLIARMPGFDGALPINTITSIIGAPVVIWVILKQRAEI